MDLTIISTYRCNSKCSMCYIWKHPSDPNEEISLDTLEKLPSGFDNLNVSGGEPTLRKDLSELIDVIYPKGRIIEISSNGLKWQKLIPIIKKYPNIKVRFSLEGSELISNSVRGEKNGYNTKIEGLKKLKDAGGIDLGFAFVIQDENVNELVQTYEMARKLGVEFATSTLHNAFQFHKSDNYFYDRMKVAKQVEKLITNMLSTSKIKNWFRAYLNLGLIEKILGHDRLIKCTAGKDFIFIDPWADVYACNVRNDLLIGNLENQTWSEILHSGIAQEILHKVEKCEQNCWMVTTARTAMRSNLIPTLPKMKPLHWVLKNKIKMMLGKSINFKDEINYDIVSETFQVYRESFLEKNEKKKVTRKNDEHYDFGKFYNS